MRFKKLLNELGSIEEQEQKAKELAPLLGTKYINDPSIKMFRGSNVDVEYFKERKIRKNRKPRHTHLTIDEIISFYEDYKRPDLPKRRESKFAATNKYKNRLYSFGDHVYLVIPEKGANIASSAKDPTNEFFGKAGMNFQMITKDRSRFFDAIKSHNCEKSKEFIKTLAETPYRSSDDKELSKAKPIRDFLSSNFMDLIREFRILEELTQTDIYIKRYVRAWDNVFDYFNTIHDGFISPAEEVMFDGDNYLVVNREWFFTYFVKSRGEWRLESYLR